MPREKLFSFGGCVYRMLVDGRHAASLAMLARMSGQSFPALASIDYRHTSNLPQGRCLWLRDQIAREPHVDWAVSCDGDTSFDAVHLLLEMTRAEGAIAMGIAPVRIGGTEALSNINVTVTDEEISKSHLDKHPGEIVRRADEGRLKKVLDGDRLIASGGFGLVVFNLSWFRTCWPEPEPEHVSIHTGEDIEFCRSVRARGGLIAALRVKTDHFAFGEKQTR